jgi:hypothetical protein
VLRRFNKTAFACLSSLPFSVLCIDEVKPWIGTAVPVTPIATAVPSTQTVTAVPVTQIVAAVTVTQIVTAVPVTQIATALPVSPTVSAVPFTQMHVSLRVQDRKRKY